MQGCHQELPWQELMLFSALHWVAPMMRTMRSCRSACASVNVLLDSNLAVHTQKTATAADANKLQMLSFAAEECN